MNSETPLYLSLVLGMAIVQSLLMSIALLTNKRGPVIANRFLAILLINMGFGLSGHLIELHSLQPRFSVCYFVSTDTAFFFGPLNYLYIRTVLEGRKALSWFSLIHFLPGLFYLIRVYLAITATQPITELRANGLTTTIMDVFWPLAKTISITGYAYWGIRRLKSNVEYLKSNLSNVDRMRFNWLKHILYFQMMLVLMSWGLVAMSAFGTASLWVESIYITGIAMVVIWISFRGYQQPEVLTAILARNLTIKNSNEVSKGDNKQELTRSELSEEDKTHLKFELEELVKVKRVYLEPDISLPKLAQMLGKRVQLVSKYLNEVEQKSFYDFINQYRIDEACRRLSDADNSESVLNIALGVGYNNKSTFNAAFKKYCGRTPTAYRKNPL